MAKDLQLEMTSVIRIFDEDYFYISSYFGYDYYTRCAFLIL